MYNFGFCCRTQLSISHNIEFVATEQCCSFSLLEMADSSTFELPSGMNYILEWTNQSGNITRFQT